MDKYTNNFCIFAKNQAKKYEKYEWEISDGCCRRVVATC